MVLFISTWIPQSSSLKHSASMDSSHSSGSSQPHSTFRYPHRTPYWEWIRSNGSDPRSRSGSSASSSNTQLGDEDEEDDYAFYYAHPERIVSISPVQRPRRPLYRGPELSHRISRGSQNERDSLATMVDDGFGGSLSRGGPDFDAYSLSGYSIGSDETAAEEEDLITPVIKCVEEDFVDGEAHPPQSTKLDGHISPRKQAGRTSKTTSSRTRTKRARGPGTKTGHEVSKDSPSIHDGPMLRKSRSSRLSIFRLFSSERAS